MKRFRPVPLDVVKSRLPSHIKLDESTYKNTSTKARFIDDDYGEFWAVPKDVFSGHGHRSRGNAVISEARTATLESVAARLPSYVVIRPESYRGINKPATFVDEEYGEFVALPKAVMKGTVHRKRAVAEKRSVRLSAEDIQADLPSWLTIVAETYTNTSTKAKFIDSEFGEFWAKPNTIRNGQPGHPGRGRRQTKQTNMDRYGATSPFGNKDIFAKAQRSMRKTKAATYWKTGEELSCRGSYEVAVVTWLNDSMVEFEWQIPFVLENGSTYYCDLYLVKEDKYVEIKGWWMQEVSRSKWEEFHAAHPNSELWDYLKLKSMGILK